MIVANPHRLVVTSLGKAAFQVVTVLERVSGLPGPELAKALYQAPRILFEGVSEEQARMLAEKLSPSGLELSVEAAKGAEDPGWLAKVKFAVANGLSVRAWGRYCAAVREDWNRMKYLVIGKVKEPVYGWAGRFAPQKRLEADPAQGGGGSKRAGLGGNSGRSEGVANVVGQLNGMGLQYFIPHLLVSHVDIVAVRDLSTNDSLLKDSPETIRPSPERWWKPTQDEIDRAVARP